jgi:hypothetical protein
MRTMLEKCASWKTPTIPSKMRTLFQGAHGKLRIFAKRSFRVPRFGDRRFVGEEVLPA